MGEDVDADGGVFKTNIGLPDKFPGRVLATPICENGFMGVALGMSITGMRPVVEIMFADFLPTAGDAIVNQLPKYRYMSGGQFTVPVTVRISSGGGAGFGTQHSATAESWYMAQPGMRIVTASSPQAAYELLRAAIRNNDPVLFYEHKVLYTRKGLVQRGTIADIGTARVLREGTDVTIVATLLMVEKSLAAAEALAAEGISAEVIDLRWIRPSTTRPWRHRCARPVAWSSPRSSGTRVAGERRSSASWPRRASRGRRRRPRSACRTTCSSPTARPWRPSSCRRQTRSLPLHGPRSVDDHSRGDPAVAYIGLHQAFSQLLGLVRSWNASIGARKGAMATSGSMSIS